MVEAPVTPGEPQSVTGKGTGIGIVVHKEHFNYVLVAGDAGREVGTGIAGSDTGAAIEMLADDQGIVRGIIVGPLSEMAFSTGFRGLVPVRVPACDVPGAAVAGPAGTDHGRIALGGGVLAIDPEMDALVGGTEVNMGRGIRAAQIMTGQAVRGSCNSGIQAM